MPEHTLPDETARWLAAASLAVVTRHGQDVGEVRSARLSDLILVLVGEPDGQRQINAYTAKSEIRLFSVILGSQGWNVQCQSDPDLWLEPVVRLFHQFAKQTGAVK